MSNIQQSHDHYNGIDPVVVSFFIVSGSGNHNNKVSSCKKDDQRQFYAFSQTYQLYVCHSKIDDNIFQAGFYIESFLWFTLLVDAPDNLLHNVGYGYLVNLIGLFVRLSEVFFPPVSAMIRLLKSEHRKAALCQSSSVS